MRNISGASICFNEFGNVLDIGFPTNYSCACNTGLALGITPNAVVDILYGFGFGISANCVRSLGSPMTTATKAALEVKDPLFAKTLCNRSNTEDSTLHASITALDAKQTN